MGNDISMIVSDFHNAKYKTTTQDKDLIGNILSPFEIDETEFLPS